MFRYHPRKSHCTLKITSLPATITAQGIYCLTGNLATSQSSGIAITINANNVTIKNGIVRGFYYGINLTGSGAVVQDMLADSNTFIGIDVNGLGALVEHNQIVNTGARQLPRTWTRSVSM
jgi:hypothetical protein